MGRPGYGKIEGRLPVSMVNGSMCYTGWPRINGTVDTVDFQDFALINN